MTTPRIEYTHLRELRGPLLTVGNVDGVGWDESAVIDLGSGERRHGVVLEVDRDLAVVQVMQGTAGMRSDRIRVEFSGRPPQIPVGPEWLGRACNGRGDPIDGGPPVLCARTAPVAGRPINPVWRLPPSDPVLTGSR